MSLDRAQLVKAGQAVNACYDLDFLEHPERERLPGQSAVVWGTDRNGPRPYGVVAFNESIGTHVCVLRGTDSIAEWESDADAFLVDCPFLPGARTHRGFTEIYASMRAGSSPLREYLATLPRPIVVAGHSLGAALATLVAADLGGAHLATFAGPAVGDDAFAHMAMSRLASNARVVNAPDLVPRLPLRIEPDFPYAHLGVAIAVDSAGVVRDAPNGWHAEHDLRTYLHLLDPSIALDPKYAP